MSERKTAGQESLHPGQVAPAELAGSDFFRLTLGAVSDAVIVVDPHAVVTYCNAAGYRLLGRGEPDLFGLSVDDVFSLMTGDSLEPMNNPLVTVLATGISTRVPPGTILIRPDGVELAIEDCCSVIRADDGALLGAVMVFHDVSEARRTMLRMTHQATHDFLTDLPNRALLDHRLAHELDVAARRGGGLAVLYLDLDNFKHVNDSLGHGAGDRLLASVAMCLRQCVRKSDTVSRFGGDEFVVLLTMPDNAAHVASTTAGKIIAALSEPHRQGDHSLRTTASIGISVYPQDGSDPETLIRNADTALYLAKEAGKNGYRFFEPAMNVEAVQRQQMEAGLRAALENGELSLAYQPKFDLRSGRLTGSEALLRWRHPVWGPVPPNRFIGVAEDFGLIGELGTWVRDTACRQLMQWGRAGAGPLHVAVNVSTQELHGAGFEAGLARTLRDTGIEPSRLQLEITEGVLMRDTEAALAKLRRVRAMGVTLAIDDFGTGYSSLSYLRRFPVDVIKIDQSFIHDIGSDPAGAVIVRAVIGMGQSLGRRIVAEGVEVPAQLEFLRQQDCDEAQGYWFSAALPANEFAARYC